MADADEIEARMARTRADLTSALEQLVERVSPAQVKARSRAAARDKVRTVLAGLPSWAPQAGAGAAMFLLLLVVRARRRAR